MGDADHWQWRRKGSIERSDTTQMPTKIDFLFQKLSWKVFQMRNHLQPLAEH